MDVSVVIEENERRKANKCVEHNPITGLNCVGDRFALSVSYGGYDTFFMPEEMADASYMRGLVRCGSIEGFLGEELGRVPSADEVSVFWLRVCEERYLHDFEFFAVVNITIRDKVSGRHIKFRLNPAQRMLLEELERQRKEGRQINVQVLKAKQMGFSTLIQMYMKWIQVIHRRNWNSVVCAHDKTASTNIRSMYDLSVGLMAPIGGVRITMTPFAGTQNIKQLAERGCRITVGTAKEPETVRSQDIKMVHFSETAFYPSTAGNNPEILESAIVSSLTDGAYTLLIRESTANGVGDFFHKQWLRAKREETAFVPVFAPWFMIDLYEESFEGGRYRLHNGRWAEGSVLDFVGTLNRYERNLFDNYELCTLENLNWRRAKASAMVNESQMRQEYPSNDIEAFQDSGQPVFRSEDLEGLRVDCCAPLSVGRLVATADPMVAMSSSVGDRRKVLDNIRFVEDYERTDVIRSAGGVGAGSFRQGLNHLHVWEYPDTSVRVSDRYVVVFDPQRGVSDSADYGVIKVLDRYWLMYGEKPTVVAMWYGRVDMHVSIWVATQVAKWYCDALLVVESNTYDTRGGDDGTEYVFDLIVDVYSNLYSRVPADKVKENVPIRYGFHTNKSTKPAIISNYIGLIAEGGYVERDAGTLDEGLTFESKEGGKTGAKDGCHDDRIMATMIGLYVSSELPTPKELKGGREGRGVGSRSLW